MQAMRSPIRSPISSAMRSALDVASTDPYGRTFLADASTGLLLPGFTYTRSGPDLWCPQADGSLKSFAANVIPREWANGRWGFRFDPGWVQRALWTDMLSVSPWVGQAVSCVDNFYVSSDGTPYSKLIADATSTTHFWRQLFAYASGEVVTVQFLLKADQESTVFLRADGSTTVWGSTSALFGSFNASTGIATAGPFAQSVSMRQIHGDAWLCTCTTVATTAAGNAQMQLVLRQNGAYIGDGFSGLLVGRFNLTNTTYPVPLTVAQGTAGTVGNHSCSALLSTLGITLGGEYSIGVDYTLANLTANYQPITVSVSDNTFNESIYQNSATLTAGREPNWAVIDGGVGQANGMGLGPSAVVGSLRKTALRARPNDFRSAFNGVLTLPDSLGTLPSVDRVYVGTNWQGTVSNALQGHVHKLWIAPSRALTDAELQAITS